MTTSPLIWTLPTGRPVQISALCGEWSNTDRSGACGMSGLGLLTQDGGLWLRGLGMARPAAYAWHQVRAAAYTPAATASHAWSFLADYDFGFLRTIISAYLKMEMLIATTYNMFSDGSQRADYWTREFFHRRGSPAPPSTPAPHGISRERDLRGDAPYTRVDPGTLAGRWVNFDPGAPGITAATVRVEGDQLAIVIDELGKDGVRRWPALPARAMADSVHGGRSIAFVATGEVFAARAPGPHLATLCAYVNRGLLTIDAHVSEVPRPDSGATNGVSHGTTNVMTRTHFYLAEESV